MKWELTATNILQALMVAALVGRDMSGPAGWVPTNGNALASAYIRRRA